MKSSGGSAREQLTVVRPSVRSRAEPVPEGRADLLSRTWSTLPVSRIVVRYGCPPLNTLRSVGTDVSFYRLRSPHHRSATEIRVFRKYLYACVILSEDPSRAPVKGFAPREYLRRRCQIWVSIVSRKKKKIKSYEKSIENVRRVRNQTLIVGSFRGCFARGATSVQSSDACRFADRENGRGEIIASPISTLACRLYDSADGRRHVLTLFPKPSA